MCQTRDAGHRRGLEQNQAGHRQQGVNLTLITDTNISSANPAEGICNVQTRSHQQNAQRQTTAQGRTGSDVHALILFFLFECVCVFGNVYLPPLSSARWKTVCTWRRFSLFLTLESGRETKKKQQHTDVSIFTRYGANHLRQDADESVVYSTTMRLGYFNNDLKNTHTYSQEI